MSESASQARAPMASNKTPAVELFAPAVEYLGLPWSNSALLSLFSGDGELETLLGGAGSH